MHDLLSRLYEINAGSVLPDETVLRGLLGECYMALVNQMKVIDEFNRRAQPPTALDRDVAARKARRL